MKVKTFQECLKEAEGKKHLMLGNGFSISLFPDIFNYKVLKEKIQDTRIKEIFEKIDTTDFEYVLQKLTESLKILECYEDEENIKNQIKEDIENLKKTLIDVIASSHPDNPNSITDEQYESCYKFLSHFDGRKYTFNYDLILYWVHMKYLNHEKKLVCKDGFQEDNNRNDTVVWNIGNEHGQNLFYIHGALHIFSNFDKIEKYTWCNIRETLKNQIENSLKENKYPIFITEGTDQHKRSRIYNNAYLARGISSLRNIWGSLFIFGHSLRDEDNHIFDVIIRDNKKLKKIFISIYGDKNSTENQRIIKKIDSWETDITNNDFAKKEFYLFDADTAKVWNRTNSLKDFN